MFQRLLLTAIAVGFSINAAAVTYDADFYHTRYNLTDPYSKLVDQFGNGYEPLYGVRNMREVLKGVLYRGGTNNAYNKHGKRNNSNPLPNEGLDHLCAEGFKTSIYLYTTNYASAPHQVNCSSLRGSNRLEYLQIDPKTKPYEILKLLHTAIFHSEYGPIYVHCWNGWHASGLISALALRQFCDVSASDAIAYWDRNADKNAGVAYQPIKNLILQFKPFADLTISKSLQNKICPSL